MNQRTKDQKQNKRTKEKYSHDDSEIFQQENKTLKK